MKSKLSKCCGAEVYEVGEGLEKDYYCKKCGEYCDLADQEEEKIPIIKNIK